MIKTKTFRKPTAANTLLQASSDHPKSLIKAIPVGQFLRARRNCSDPDDFIAESKDLYNRFRERGYSHSCIREARRRATRTDRLTLLAKKKKDPKLLDSQGPPRIITKFGAHWDQVRSILNQHWHILSESPILGKIVGTRLLLTARRSKNLKDSLIHSEYQRSSTPNWLTQLPPLKGMFRCGRCSVCKYVERTNTFTDSDGKKLFKINNFINCNTTRVIYMLTCPCGKHYVGKTKRPLRVRVSEHIQSILGKDDERPIPLHFLQVHGGKPDGLIFKGIYRLNLPQRRGDFDRILYQKEKMWIYNINSMHPQGLNNECNLGVFLTP